MAVCLGLSLKKNGISFLICQPTNSIILSKKKFDTVTSNPCASDLVTYRFEYCKNSSHDVISWINQKSRDKIKDLKSFNSVTTVRLSYIGRFLNFVVIISKFLLFLLFYYIFLMLLYSIIYCRYHSSRSKIHSVHSSKILFAIILRSNIYIAFIRGALGPTL